MTKTYFRFWILIALSVLGYQLMVIPTLFAQKTGINTELQTLKSQAYTYQSSNPDSSLIYAKEVIQIADVIADELSVAEMNFLIGKIIAKSGNFKMAVDFLHQSLETYTEAGLKLKVAEVRSELGRICSIATLFDAAESHLDDAMEIYIELEDQKGIATAFCDYGLLYEKKFEPYEALSYYKKADSVNKILNDFELKVFITEAFASIYEDVALYDKAMEYYQLVFPMYQNNIYDKIDVLNNIGDIYRKTNKPQKALEYYQQAYDLALEKKIPREVQQNLLDMALSYEKLGNISKALELYKKHEELYLRFYDEVSISSINQLQILYESEKKSKEIELERSNSNSRTLERNIVIFGLAVFILFSIFLWIGLRQKNRLNNMLKKQTQETEDKNKELESLIERLARTQEQLVQSEKMAAVGTLAAGIAHEINNPLNFIQTGQAALENYFDTQLKEHKGQVEPLLKAIINGVERASTIVNGLNQFSRRTENYEEICNIHVILDNCLAMLSYKLKNKVEVVKNYSSERIECKGNDGKLHQVILNLLENSIYAINEKGTIGIKTSIGKKKLKIEITDDGDGIDAANLKKIRDPFFTTKDPGKGTGLGLSISNTIIKDHNGSLDIESAVGIGTKVTITLPKNIV